MSKCDQKIPKGSVLNSQSKFATYDPYRDMRRREKTSNMGVAEMQL